MREIIESFLNSERKSIPLQFHPLETYSKILKDFGFTHDFYWDDGGQDINFEATYKNSEKDEVVLTGSLYRGGFSLSKTVKDDLRRCHITGEEMTEGFCFNNGEYYIKYEKDALEWVRQKGYKDLDESYEDDFHYWTEWDIND